jgi:serine/threonine protein kinase
MNPADFCPGCMEQTSAAPICPNCGWDLDAAPESALRLPPRTILQNQYLIGRVLGHGGFGITYLALDLNLACKLAVKEYLPYGVAARAGGSAQVTPFSTQTRQDFEWGLEKFLEEGRTLARFQRNPGIASVVNFFRANGTAYLAMEYLEGQTLAQYLEERGWRIPLADAVRILTPVMNALSEVHGAGVLHRDISPDNIFITKSGVVKLLDFGAARYALGQQSRNLSVILKQGYAPEEQYRTKGVQGPWTDVYATAATLYRAITGKNLPASLDRMNTDDLFPPSKLGVDIPPAMERSLLKGLAVRAADRFQSIEDFRDAMTGAGTAAPTPDEPVPPPAPKKGIPLAVWIAVAAAVLIAILYFVTQGSRKTPTSSAAPASDGTQADSRRVSIAKFEITPASRFPAEYVINAIHTAKRSAR